MTRQTKFFALIFCALWLSVVVLVIENFPVNGEECPGFSCPGSICSLKTDNKDFCSRVKCLGITPSNCPAGSFYQEKLMMCGCCPGCAIYQQLGEHCSLHDAPEISDKCIGSVCAVNMNKCDQGLRCPPNTYLCSLQEQDTEKESECLYKRTLYSNGDLHWQPECDEDGTYSKKQCKGTFFDGTCFCANKEGTRIFGREWRIKAENQTCECSRRVYELRENRGLIASMHCSQDGNFEPLQCDLESGICYCVDTKTGETNGAILPENKWTDLPCYNRTFWGEDGHYLRRCESSWAAWLKLKNEASLHGLAEINAGEVSVCDYDGSFAPKQSKGNRDSCHFKGGSQIADYFAQQGVNANMDCRCARETVMYREEGRQFTLTCSRSSGNYAPTSTFERTNVRCVDGDGFFFGEPVESSLECCLLNNCRITDLNQTCVATQIKTCAEYVI